MIHFNSNWLTIKSKMLFFHPHLLILFSFSINSSSSCNFETSFLFTNTWFGTEMLFSINVWYTSLRSKSVHCLVTSFTMNGFRNFTYMCAFSNGNPRLKKLINASTIGHDSMGSFKMTSSGKTMMSNSLNADKRWRMDCICAELDFLFIAHIPSLTFLCRGGILRGMVFVVGAPGCSPSRTKRTKKQLSLSLSLSFCVCACL